MKPFRVQVQHLQHQSQVIVSLYTHQYITHILFPRAGEVRGKYTGRWISLRWAICDKWWVVERRGLFFRERRKRVWTQFDFRWWIRIRWRWPMISRILLWLEFHIWQLSFPKDYKNVSPALEDTGIDFDPISSGCGWVWIIAPLTPISMYADIVFKIFCLNTIKFHHCVVPILCGSPSVVINWPRWH